MNMGTVHDIDELRRADLARVVMSVLDEWHVAPQQQAELLGLSDETPAGILARIRDDVPTSDSSRLMQRISYILAIRNALHTMHPHNAAMADYWVTTPHPYFNDQPPLTVMLQRGLDGMRRIAEHLNGTGKWG